MLREQTIQYIISEDSDMLVHEGGNLVVAKSSDWYTGQGVLFDPAAPSAPVQADDTYDVACEGNPRDLGHIIDDLVARYGSESKIAAAAAAVCLSYAMLVKTDYHSIQGAGPKKALEVLEQLLKQGLKAENWPDPELLASMLSKNLSWPEERKNHVTQQMCKAKGGLLAGSALHLAWGKIDTLNKDVMATTNVTDLIGETCLDKDQVGLIYLGILCFRKSCECRMSERNRHNVGGEITHFQAQDELEASKLTEELNLGAKLNEDDLIDAKRWQLARWLRTRGFSPRTNMKVNELRKRVRGQLKIEATLKEKGRDIPNLRCPEGLSALQLLRNNGCYTRDLPIIDNAETDVLLKAIPDDQWITGIGEMQERAPVLTENVLQKHYSSVCTSNGVLEKGYKRICFRTHLRGFGVYFPPNSDGVSDMCWLKLLCPRSMVNCVYAVFALCNVAWRGPGRPPIVTKIRDQKCECAAARADGGCLHVSALLQAVQNLNRNNPEGVCATRKACKWNRPTKELDDTHLRKLVEFLRSERGTRGPSQKRRKREFVCTLDAPGRSNYNPYSPQITAMNLRDLMENGNKSHLVSAAARCVKKGAEALPGGESGFSIAFGSVWTDESKSYLWKDKAAVWLNENGLANIEPDASDDLALDPMFDDSSDNDGEDLNKFVEPLHRDLNFNHLPL